MKSIFFLLLIFLISLTSAYYPMDIISVNNTLGSDELNYTLIDNSTAIEGLIFNITLNQINITLPANLAPDSFTILLIYNATEQLIEVTNSGSRSSGGSYGGIHKINKTLLNKTISNCNLNEKKCVDKELWYCEDGKWKSNICEYGCEEGNCNIPEIPKTDLRTYFLWTLMFIILGIFILTIIWKKRKEKKEKDND